MSTLWPSPSFWLALVGAVLAFVLLWWTLLGAARSSRRRALDARIRLWERTQTAPTPAALQALHAASLVARQSLCVAGERRLLYRRPWLLFVSDPAADLVSLLASAHPAGPVETGTMDAGAAFWRWWLMGGLAAIEVCPPPVAPAQPQNALWFRALRELAVLRPRLPLNGAAMCISVGTLLADASVARPIFDLLCRRLQDTALGLRVQLPVYVIVTGLQRLPGYASVHAALDPDALLRVLGHRVDGHVGEDGSDSLHAAFTPLRLQLQALRMGLLRQTFEPARRAEIHGFVESVQALEPGLALLVERLVQSEGWHHTLSWRGLYLTASGPQSAFVLDLFQRLMPADQGLARALS